ncbi:MAG: BrnT family toxin [Bdellovibrionales bacterium]
MNFEWDDDKSEVNRKKHGIRFEEAQTVFLDPHSIEFYDERHSESEDRFIRIGFSGRPNILLVVYCVRDENRIRLISARKATAKERRVYEKGI